MNVNVATAARVPAGRNACKDVMAIPPTANVDAMATSATDDTASKRLGRFPAYGNQIKIS
jgi:hypothetical protein